jgi:hypothetical protein
MNKKIIISCIVFLLIVNLVCAPEDTEKPKVDVEKTEDYYKTVKYIDLDFSTVPSKSINSVVQILEQRGAFNDLSFYQETNNLDQLLAKLPNDKANLIDAGKVIDAGHGKSLTQVQIAENINEVNDLNKLDANKFSKYFKDTYGKNVGIVVSGCQPKACTLKQGVLKNTKNQVNMNNFNGRGVSVVMNKQGEIIMDLQDLKPNDLKQGEIALLNLDSNDRLTLNNIPGKGIALENQNSLAIFKGDIEIKEGKLAKINPSDSGTEINSVLIKTWANPVELVYDKNKVNSKKNNLFMSDDKIIASGDKYALKFEDSNDFFESMIKHDKSVNIRNGHQLSFFPSSSEDINKNSLITIKRDPEFKTLSLVSIDGSARIVNGDQAITAKNSKHFLSELGGFVSGEKLVGKYIQPDDQQFNLVPMNLEFAGTNNRIKIENNNLKIGGDRTVHYSVEYNEQGSLDIEEHLGSRSKGKVAEPEIVVFSPRTGNVGACGYSGGFGCDGISENEAWAAMKDITLKNKNKNKMILYYDFEGINSVQKNNQQQADKLLKDILGASQDVGGENAQVTFYGHSAYYPKEKTYGFSTTKKGGGPNIPINELSNIDFVGCAATKENLGVVSGPESGLFLRQSLTLATFEAYKTNYPRATLKTTSGQKDFVKALTSGKIKMPTENCKEVSQEIQKSLNEDNWYGDKGLGGKTNWPARRC